MKNEANKIVSLDKVVAPALYAAFLKAAERAKKTQTYLVIEKNGKIERIPYEKIDSFISKLKNKDREGLD